MEKGKRILAWAGILLLAGMYLLTLVFALIDSEWAGMLFRGCVACTILVPVILYAYILVYRMLKKKKNEPPQDSKS
ncbi:MAG TPA: hypothetical protein IAB44_05870 [Candidatus Limivivens intestinipullorum]|uniref:Uncharacterized protein n=1 Tax=Candidatus Limivivens intestinipullorum TaxID=2840858 RepID=A0A9D1ESA9_9FIRM|nr:hypothetical protein [Candidatus Limivivens intestinipullorum]